MPFKSKAQEKFLEIHHPEVAKEFAAVTPANAKLPEHVSNQSSSDEITPERKVAAMKAMIGYQDK